MSFSRMIYSAATLVLASTLASCDIVPSSAWKPLTQTWVDQATVTGTAIDIPAGRYAVGEDLRFPAGSETRIHPGAVFKIDSGKSLLFFGRLDAQGTAEEPIEFFAQFLPGRRFFDALTEPFERFVGESAKGQIKSAVHLPSAHWGGLALIGPGASGSVIRHARIERGRAPFFDATGDAAETRYTGAVSVYGTSALIEQSLFRLNFSDSVSAVDAQLTVRQCHFEKNNNDAIDYDRSKGLIEDNTIAGSNADGIDVLGSDVVIRDNRVSGCKDTGIEIGQRSKAQIEGNDVSGSGLGGIDLSDESTAIVRNNRLSENTAGMRLFVLSAKDYLWSAKVAVCEGNDLTRNGQPILQDATAQLTCQ